MEYFLPKRELTYLSLFFWVCKYNSIHLSRTFLPNLFQFFAKTSQKCIHFCQKQLRFCLEATFIFCPRKKTLVVTVVESVLCSLSNHAHSSHSYPYKAVSCDFRGLNALECVWTWPRLNARTKWAWRNKFFEGKEHKPLVFASCSYIISLCFDSVTQSANAKSIHTY